MKPRIHLAVLFALLACSAALPDISVDQVNPPPPLSLIESHKETESDGVKPKANIPEVKEGEGKLEVIKETDKPKEVELEDVPKVTKSEIVPKPVEEIKEEVQPQVAPQAEDVEPAAKAQSGRLRGKVSRSSSMSIEDLHDREFDDAYVPFKAANAGGHLPPNQMRPHRQQAQVAAQYPHYAGAPDTEVRADKRKRPSHDKNKKKSSNKKRRTSSNNNRKKDKKKVQPTKPAPTKKPVNKNRRGQVVNQNNNHNAAYRPNKHHNNNNNNHHPKPHQHANPQHAKPHQQVNPQYNQLNKPNNNVQKNRRKATPAPPNAVNKNKKQPNRRSPNTRRRPTTKRPAARRRKQTYKEAYYNDETY